jgi:hypothetical protein
MLSCPPDSNVGAKRRVDCSYAPTVGALIPLSNGACLNCVAESPLSKISAPDLPTCNVLKNRRTNLPSGARRGIHIYQIAPKFIGAVNRHSPPSDCA